jgi:integrase
LVLTGLRRNELATLTVGQLDLDTDPAYLTLEVANEKNREGNSLPLRSDLAADLRQWLADKATARQDAARNAETVPFDVEAVKARRHDSSGFRGSGRRVCQDWTTLPADTPVFDVLAGLVRILDRDLKAAGIPKMDDRGRTVDVHALRHTFGSHLSAAGVQPRTAQAAMRHSNISLTMNTYTDPALLDLAGAVERLPSLPLDGTDREAGQATGTDGKAASLCPPISPLPFGNLCKSGVIPDNSTKPDVELPKREKPANSLENAGFSGVLASGR